ncbi:MAG: hypothetical protein M1119_04865 [Firmicutes bacterium]|nr:hypothetical protein [Bacillota bacterium]
MNRDCRRKHFAPMNKSEGRQKPTLGFGFSRDYFPMERALGGNSLEGHGLIKQHELPLAASGLGR